MILHYDMISEFKRQFYKDILGIEHLQAGEIKIDKVSFPDGGSEEEFNFWGYQLEKNNVKYLLPSKNPDGTEIKVHDILPIMPKDCQKVAHRGTVYQLINKPVSVRFRPEKKMSFKELVNKMNNLEHTNNTHRRLLCFIAFASMMDRCNFRISSPPSFGKDSVVDTFGNLLGGAFTIENPTIAKLEYMTYAKWLAVNEIVDIQKAEWRNIEQFLLSAGAHKPEITKHSRAIANGTKEIIDISKFSLSLLYNDIDCYPEVDKYVDSVTKSAVLDRFPAFRLYGTLSEDFNKTKGEDIPKYVTEHIEEYKDIIYTYTYFKINLNRELKRFKADNLVKGIPSRWLTNISRLLKVIDLYCDTQEEFNEWIEVINKALQDYKDMLIYPELLSKTKHKMKPEELRELRKISTFSDRVKILGNYQQGKVGKEFWSGK